MKINIDAAGIPDPFKALYFKAPGEGLCHSGGSMSTRMVRLTDAAMSALECAGLKLDETPGIILRSWKGKALRFTETEREELFDALNEASNAEDAQAIEKNDKFARRAAKTLALVASRVLLSKI